MQLIITTLCRFKPWGQNISVRHVLAIFILFFALTPSGMAATVLELSVKGSIGPATADYLSRGIEKGQDAELILIKLDTPGGLTTSTRQIVKAILTAQTPVVTYVAPSGARAASAGTYILYASTIAAMAPGTHLGAASPVNMMQPMSQKEKNEDQEKSTMDKKVTHDAVAYIRTLAQLRNRDPSFAEKAVLDAATLTASEALKAGAINFTAQNTADLFAQMDGISVEQNGRTIKLNLKNYEIQQVLPDWRMKFLLVVTDPTIAYMLLLLGIYGIFFEFMNPGFIVPGVIGAVAIVIALYALQLLPINYAGLALIILGIIFIVAEAFAPSFGALGLGGTVAFIVGSILLIDTEHQGYQIAWSAIWAMAAANIIIFLTIFSMAVKARREPVQHGTKTLVGRRGRTIEVIDLDGQAVVGGEIWRVRAKTPIAADKPIKIVDAKGLTLDIEEIQGE